METFGIMAERESLHSQPLALPLFGIFLTSYFNFFIHKVRSSNDQLPTFIYYHHMTASKNLDPSKLRFIAMDMDGTILDEGYQLSPHVADTLKKLQNQGKKLIIATGRIYKAAKIVLADSFEPDAFVCTNGADIYNRDGAILASHHIPAEALPILTKVSRDHDVLFCCYVGERWIYDRYSPGVDFTKSDWHERCSEELRLSRWRRYFEISCSWPK